MFVNSTLLFCYYDRMNIDIAQTIYSLVAALVGGLVVFAGWMIVLGRKLQTLDNIAATVEKIKSNLKVVSDCLVKSEDIEFNPSELQNYSPFALTQEGKDFITKLGFDNAFSTHTDDFFKFIDDQEPKLKYDVEIAAIKSIYALLDEGYMEFLKVYLYENPKRTIGNVAPTLGVYVRDRYLEKHPEIVK